LGEIPVLRTTDGKEFTYYPPDYVEERLREAGMVIRMLPLTGCFPSSYRSFWPDIVHSFEDAYGWTEPAPVKIRPTMAQMDRFNEVLGWLPILVTKKNMRTAARVIAYRMQTHVDTGNPVWSWRKIGKELKMSKDTARSEYLDGVRVLSVALTDMANPT
jgi:hypothetical protein